ncbi:gliding motility-associated C-terminal domain-containing protein [Mucilaginibacter sp. HD30]
MIKYVLGLLFFWSCAAFGQTFYVGTNMGQLKRVTINGNNATYQDIATCPDLSMGSMAIHKNVLYTANGYVQYQATISGNTLINCSPISNIPLSNALTIDKEGNLYSVNGHYLYKTDQNRVTTLLGEMPFTSAGDLAFFNGVLYMASPAGIVEINLSDTQLSKLTIPSNLIIFSITTAAYSSTQNKLYAMAVNNNVTSIYEVDIPNKTLGSIIATLPFQSDDAASDAEDGTLQPIAIRTVQTVSDCPYTGRGTVQIICDNALIDYSYTLNGITNNTGVFNNVPAGAYTATIKSPGETVTSPIAVNYVVEKPTLTITQNNPLCAEKGRIKIAALPGDNLYKIQYNGNLYNLGQTFTDLAAGNYHFSILNQSGCEVDKIDLVLTQPPCPVTISQILINEECNSPGKGRLQLTTTVTNDVYTYTLGASVNNIGLFTNLDPANYNIHIASSNGQFKDIQVVVPDYNAAKPIISTVATNVQCDVLGTISFTLPVADFASYTVKYLSSTFPLAHMFTGFVAGTYQFSIYKPDGCLFAVKEVVLIKNQCAIQYSATDIAEECNNPGKGVINVKTLPHTDIYNYSLDANLTSNTGVFNNIIAGDHVLKITNADGEKIITVTVPDYNATKPSVQFEVNNLLCDASASVKFVISDGKEGPYKIKFSTNIYAFDHIFSVTIAGSYHFEIIKPDGCVLKKIDVPVSRSKCEIELLAPAIEQECDVIFKGHVQINSKPHTYAYTYKLSSGGVNNDGLFTNLSPGNYSVTVSSIEDSKQFDITIPDYKALSPAVSISKADAECDLQGLVKFNISANSNGYIIKLHNSIFPFDHQFKLNEGGYDFVVFKPNGCIFDSYHIDVAKLPCDVMKLPSAFTPNGDGINDIFEPNQGSDAVNYNLKIYSRNGMLLFNSNALQNGWRGEQNGKAVAAGVYYWMVTYTNNTGKNLSKSGSVTLLR